MGKCNFSKVSVLFLMLLILNSSNAVADSSQPNSDAIKVYQGMILEYETKWFSGYLNSPEEISEVTYLIQNDTRTILEIDHSTGFMVVRYQWGPDIESMSMVYNTTMDTFGEMAIFVDWNYWENNIDEIIDKQSNRLHPDLEVTSVIINNDNYFGYQISQSGEFVTFERISKYSSEIKQLYSKSFGVLTEDKYERIEVGPNGRTEYSFRSYILTTELTETLSFGFIEIVTPFLLMTILILIVYRLYIRMTSKELSSEDLTAK